MSDTICICKTCNHKHEWESRRQGDYCTYCPNCDDPMYDQVPRIEVPTTQPPELTAKRLEAVSLDAIPESTLKRLSQHQLIDTILMMTGQLKQSREYGRVEINRLNGELSHSASQLHSLRSRLDEANKPFVDADSRIQIIQNDNTFSYKVASVLALGFNTWREAYRAGEDYLNQIEAAKEADSLRSELATAKERIGELEKNEDIWSRRLAEATEERRALQATIASQSEDLKKLRVCLALVLASAHPHPINNVPMYSVWREGEKVLAETMPISHSTKAEGENS